MFDPGHSATSEERPFPPPRASCCKVFTWHRLGLFLLGDFVARIFISHRSQNNDRAIQLRDWLVANGWDDFFLDLDPEQGIAPGEKWKEALRLAAHRCEAVIALVSPEWLARPWCLAELNTAQ